MSTPDDYRAMAEECFRWARQAQTEDKRQAYLDVARTWLEAASGQDCGVAAQSEALMGAVSIAVLAQQCVGPAGILDGKVDKPSTDQDFGNPPR
jgi:hypothetical protein